MAMASEFDSFPQLKRKTSCPELGEFEIQPYSEITIQGFSAFGYRESQPPPPPPTPPSPGHECDEFGHYEGQSSVICSEGEESGQDCENSLPSHHTSPLHSKRDSSKASTGHATNPVTISQPDKGINPYAEISLKPVTTQSNMAELVHDTASNIKHSTVGTSLELPTMLQVLKEKSETSINPYAQIKIIKPQNFPSLAVPHITVDAWEVKSEESNFRRRYSVGPSTFLRANSDIESSLDRIPGGRKRLSLRGNKLQSIGNENKGGEASFADVLADLRSSGVSFVTNNPRPRKKERMPPRRRSSTWSGRRRMTVGARLLRRPTDHQSSMGKHIHRKMSIGAGFIRKPFRTRAATLTTQSSTTQSSTSMRRKSVGARMWNHTRKGFKKRQLFSRKISSIPEATNGGEELKDSTSEGKSKSGWKGSTLSLGAQLWQLLPFNRERSTTLAPQPQDMEPNIDSYCHEETASTCSGDLGNLNTILLKVLKTSGIHFPTNRILESREIARAALHMKTL